MFFLDNGFIEEDWSDIECIGSEVNTKISKKRRNVQKPSCLTNSFIIFHLIDLLIICGMCIANTWESVVEKLRIILKFVTDVSVL